MSNFQKARREGKQREQRRQMRAHPAEVVGQFQALAAAHPDIAEAFLEARDVWHSAVAQQSHDLAEASGIAFGRLCELVESRRAQVLQPPERSILREMLQSRPTPAEALQSPHPGVSSEVRATNSPN